MTFPSWKPFLCLHLLKSVLYVKVHFPKTRSPPLIVITGCIKYAIWNIARQIPTVQLVKDFSIRCNTQITLLFPLTQDCYRVKLTLLTILLELNIVSYYRITKYIQTLQYLFWLLIKLQSKFQNKYLHILSNINS